MARSVVIVFGALVLAACVGHDPVRAPDDGPNATVVHIVDGDTIDVEIGGDEERVRLIGIDTPEIAHPAMGSRPANEAECYGDEAAAFTTSLLDIGTPVRIERDVVARDDYGRLLGYVSRASDGIMVNYELARQGYAQPLTIPPNSAYSKMFVDAARDAHAGRLGLWSACSGTDMSE